MPWRLILFALMLPALASQSSAQAPVVDAGPLYEIELVVFRNLSQSRNTAETASLATLADAATRPAPAAASISAAAAAYTPLGAQSLQLGAVVGQLRRAGSFQPLLHTGWSQNAPGQAEALAVPLPPEATASGLQGSMTLYRQRFLHLLVNLELGEGGGEAMAAPFRISQVRRVRGTRLHYFDHPRFGAIVAVRRVATDPADMTFEDPEN